MIDNNTDLNQSFQSGSLTAFYRAGTIDNYFDKNMTETIGSLLSKMDQVFREFHYRAYLLVQPAPTIVPIRSEIFKLSPYKSLYPWRAS